MALISGPRFSGSAKPGGGVADIWVGGRGTGRVCLESWTLGLSVVMATSLVDDAEGPQDDLASEQQATDGEPVGQPSDLLAVEVDVALDPMARRSVCV